jgi:hypothetical protein
MDRTKFEKDMLRFASEMGQPKGAVSLYVLWPQDILAGYYAGDALSRRAFDGTRRWFKAVDGFDTPDSAPLCLACNTAFYCGHAKPAAFMAAVPTFRPIEECGMIITAICQQCAKQPPEALLEVGKRQWQKLMPDAIELPQEGNA